MGCVAPLSLFFMGFVCLYFKLCNLVFKLKVLLTGANGYIGTRLLHVLVEKGYHVVALVRSARRFILLPHLEKFVEVIKNNHKLDKRGVSTGTVRI